MRRPAERPHRGRNFPVNFHAGRSQRVETSQRRPGCRRQLLGSKRKNLPLTNWVPSQFLCDRRLRHRSSAKLRLPAWKRYQVAVKPEDFGDDRQRRTRRYRRIFCLPEDLGFSHDFNGLAETLEIPYIFLPRATVDATFVPWLWASVNRRASGNNFRFRTSSLRAGGHNAPGSFAPRPPTAESYALQVGSVGSAISDPKRRHRGNALVLEHQVLGQRLSQPFCCKTAISSREPSKDLSPCGTSWHRSTVCHGPQVAALGR